MIPIADPYLGEEELKNVIEAVKSGWISSKGKFITEFEEKFAEYCGCKHGITTSSGTTALHLALKALGIKKGDEVIVPTLSFIATANAVTYCDAKPVFVDSHPVYWCIDPEKIEEKITENTKAIIPVHLFGHPCDMDAIIDLVRDSCYDLYVVEDAAEAHGAEYKGKKVGSFGDISCFSFFANKIITTGEGGMCLTDNEELAERMRVLRDHGMNPHKKYWHDVVGFNYRMTNMQAAIGVAQLEKIEKIIQIKRRNANIYNLLLKDVNGIDLPIEEKWAINVYWMYSVLIDHRISRDDLMKKLEEKGIDSRPFFYPIHTMPPYRNGVFPIAEVLSKIGMSLPSSANLKIEEIESIYGVCIDFMSEQ